MPSYTSSLKHLLWKEEQRKKKSQIKNEARQTRARTKWAREATKWGHEHPKRGASKR